jgi:Gram-negative bacterial TonB protein C-terminal
LKKFRNLLLVLSFFSLNFVVAQNSEIDELPCFAGCETYKPHSKEKRACSMSNLAYYLEQHLIYPDSAKAKGISGIVYVTFTVEIDGSISNVNVLNDIGEGCGAMAKKVVAEMPLWEAATLKEQAVAYELRLPIQFLLDDEQQWAKNYAFFWGDLRYNEIQTSDLEKYLKQAILVRNIKGEQVPIVNMSVFYENGRVKRSAKGLGKLNSDMIRIIRHAKAGGKLTFSTTLQQKGTFFELYRTFNIK